MKTEDARSLPAKAQEALRRRVVQAVREGLTQAEAARLFGVARGTVNGWMGLWEREGSPGLKARRRGRPPCPRLAPPQSATTVRLILSRCPDQLRLPFALWTREAVQQLLARRFGVQVSVWTVGRYLRAWGLTPRTKPGRRAAMVAEGIPGHPGASQARKGRDSLGRRDGAALRSSCRPLLWTPRPDARGAWHRSALPLQPDLGHHQSRSTGFHGFSPALHRAGLSEFSASPAASDPRESVSDFGSPPRAQVCAGESLAGKARGAHPALLASVLQPGTESR